MARAATAVATDPGTWCPADIPEVLDAVGDLRAPGRVPRFTVAGIGTRDLTPNERVGIRALADWVMRHGGAVRSGGAVDSDTEWAYGAAAVDPARVTLCLPEDSPRYRARVPAGAVVEVGPWPQWMQDAAIAEVALGARIETHGLPPYADADLSDRLARSTTWDWLCTNKPGTEGLLTRNVAIVHLADIALGPCNPKQGGGGTGRAMRIMRAMGRPACDLRRADDLARAHAALAGLARGLAVPPPAPRVVQGSLF